MAGAMAAILLAMSQPATVRAVEMRGQTERQEGTKLEVAHGDGLVGVQYFATPPMRYHFGS